MPFCQNCGNQVPGEAHFCRQCGQPINTAPSDQQVNPPLPEEPLEAQSPGPAVPPEAPGDSPRRRSMFSTPIGEMTGGQRTLLLFLCFLTILVFSAVVCAALVSRDYEYDSGYSSGEPSLAEYWDRAACSDLSSRVELMRAMGATNQEMQDSFYRAEGAVKRYGPYEVFTHCRSKYKDDWNAGR